MLPEVSIIIPAHNAAATLDTTLESVLRQTSPHWEAIIIENGSTDATAAVAAAWVLRDPRVRVITSPPGVSVARNAGLALARHPWILFLDADDWIEPTHLERLTRQLLADPSLDAAHCGWRRVGPDGETISEDFGPADVDLFPRLARTCAITIHSCITRRALIAAAGGFDPTLRTCEDWDLWQRLARIGCRFGAVREVLACYRARAGSASMNAGQLVRDSRLVIERGRSRDPRVASPRPEYADGYRGDDPQETLLYTVAWAAGLCIGSDQDARELLDFVEVKAPVALDAHGIAGCIFCCAMLPQALPTSAWAEHFERHAPRLSLFLEELERRSQQPGLARSVLAHLSRMTLDEARRPRPFTAGPLHAEAVEISTPLADLHFPVSVERVHCNVLLGGEKIGSLELPAFDGALPAPVLTDAIAAEFAWVILARFFADSVYPSLTPTKLADGWAVHRGAQWLGGGIEGNGVMSWQHAHEQIGWSVFLQELWGEPTLTSDEFYAAKSDRATPPPANIARAEPPLFTVEVSEPWPDAWSVSESTAAVLTVGGAPVVRVPLEPVGGIVTARALRAAANTAAAFEFCSVAVREALIGRPIREGGSLRERLAARARARRPLVAETPAAADGFAIAAGAPVILEECATADEPVAALARRPGRCGTSASRRAQLPRALWPEVAAVSQRRGEPVLHRNAGAGEAPRLLYLPEVIWSRRAAPAQSAPGGRGNSPEGYVPEFFEQLFQSKANPWFYTSAYETTKYAQTLEILPRPRYRRALELACAEGHFTRLLAPRVAELLATDVSPTALQRAATRCGELGHVRFAPLDLMRDALPGRFDLIVCSEVLYYAGSLERLRGIARKIAAALAPGGQLVMAHAHLLVDEPHRAGFDWDLPFGARRISDVFHATSSLVLVRDLRTPLYRIQVFERRSLLRRLRSVTPERILLPQPTELPPHVAARARWRGGAPLRALPEHAPRSSQLPILMYHRIAPAATGGRERYRTTPENFDAQLRLLADRGFHSVTLDEWQKAMETRRPLPGRCVALTFDDGYHDFLEHAWPALQRRGFGATVFLPTAEIAGTNRWDLSFGETYPLLDWGEVRRLHNEGVEFGSHAAHHVALTSLSPTEIAREALQSRWKLEDELGVPINSIAYPYGEADRVVQQLVGGCGYAFGLTCEERACGLQERLLSLPRFEVRGDMTLAEFAALLPEESASTRG